jgi:glycosyltransferase involved in cell wall biosynthesis
MYKLPITVIIPNFNSGDYLIECVESINIGILPEEIIIIDDCSTDGSYQKAINLGLRYSNIKLYKLPENKGAIAARKIGIEYAANEFVALVDADDKIEYGALQTAFDKIKLENADICIFDLWHFNEIKEWRHPANPSKLPLIGYEAMLLTLDKWQMHIAGICKKKLYQKAYYDFDQTAFNADELLTRVVLKSANCVVGCKKKYYYRDHAQSSTQNLSIRNLSSLRSRIWLMKFVSDIPEAPIKKMIRNAIAEAWYYWVRRNKIGIYETLKELNKFIHDLRIIKKNNKIKIINPKINIAIIIIKISIIIKK